MKDRLQNFWKVAARKWSSTILAVWLPRPLRWSSEYTIFHMAILFTLNYQFKDAWKCVFMLLLFMRINILFLHIYFLTVSILVHISWCTSWRISSWALLGYSCICTSQTFVHVLVIFLWRCCSNKTLRFTSLWKCENSQSVFRKHTFSRNPNTTARLWIARVCSNFFWKLSWSFYGSVWFDEWEWCWERCKVGTICCYMKTSFSPHSLREP